MNSSKKIRLGGSYATMTISISLVLLIFGIMALLLVNSEKLSNYIKENIVVTVMFKDSISSAEMMSMEKNLSLNPHVKSTKLISPEEAAKRLVDDTGEDFVSFLGYVPLPYSLDITVKSEFASSENIEQLTNEIKKKPIVGNVHYQQNLVNEIDVNTGRISIFLLGFALLIFIISFGLINNTVRLSVYSKRFIIRSMLLVGATRSFVRRPYLWQAVWMGLVASLISIILLEGILIFTYSQIPDLRVIQSNTDIILVFTLVVFLGVFISWISSRFALNKYIKMKTEYLYS